MMSCAIICNSLLHNMIGGLIANIMLYKCVALSPMFCLLLIFSYYANVLIYMPCFSQQLYCQIVDAQVDYPANWDKNLALAAERLLRSGGGNSSPDTLLSRSILHFTSYLEREPTDPQRKAIRSTISHLRKERDRLRGRQKG